VFVTGHTGFKGAWLCEWLLMLGAEVVGFSLPEPVSDPSLFDQLGLRSRLKHLEGDIRDQEFLREALVEEAPDYVFHLAAQPLVRLSYEKPVMTFQTNVMGSIHVLEALRSLALSCGRDRQPPVAVMITTDKCYENREWLYGYREGDPLGGHDPYSSSKAACEIAISAWRNSFLRDLRVRIASARAGNVVGGGDWARDRLVPDCVRALVSDRAIAVRNKASLRPWQHVLEPLSGYLLLAARMADVTGKIFVGESLPSPTGEFADTALEAPFNFGPGLSSNRTVGEVVEEILKHWPGEWLDGSDLGAPHEAGRLNLATDKAFHALGWSPRWDFQTTMGKTVYWYREVASGRCSAQEAVRRDLEAYIHPAS